MYAIVHAVSHRPACMLIHLIYGSRLSAFLDVLFCSDNYD